MTDNKNYPNLDILLDFIVRHDTTTSSKNNLSWILDCISLFIILALQSALQGPLIHPVTHTFAHQWRLLPCKVLPPLLTRRERDFIHQPFGY